MTSGEEGGRANKKRPRRAEESPQGRRSSSPRSVPLFLAPLKFGLEESSSSHLLGSSSYPGMRGERRLTRRASDTHT